MENLNYLFAAYSIVWVFIFSYLMFLHLRQRKLQTEMALFKTQLESSAKTKKHA